MNNLTLNRIPFGLFCLFLFLHTTVLLGEIRLPKLVSDNMVLQRDTRLKIWGWADEQEKVEVTFKGKKYSTTTGPDGKWAVWLSPTKAGGPYSMEIKGETNNITLNNILVGDVWVCAGQSNMVHYLELHLDRYANAVAAANYPEIRQFLIPARADLQGPSHDHSEGIWKEANPENVLRFSVIAYFFAKKLYDKYGIPIGLINASVGGTPIEAWISEAGLKEFPYLTRTLEENRDTAFVNSSNRKAAAIQEAVAKTREEDKGLEGQKKWYDPTYEPKNWRRINIPGYWEDQGIRDLNGVVWYRKVIEVPASMTGVPAKLAMGRIVDADNIYVNGVQVGNKTYQYPQRRYEVPAGLLKPGKNIFAIRVTNYGGKGGFVPDKPYYLAAAGDTLDLKGYWQYKVGAVYPPVPYRGGGIFAQNQPSALYNGMVAPITNFAIKGILWYQGESNAGRPEGYKKLLLALIADWRNQWGLAVPFLYVQLPNFMEVNYLPSESNWAELRQAQLEALEVPNTAMAVAIDLGEWNDIHPGNKKPVGDRLALAAQKLTYGDKDVVYSGPAYRSASVKGNQVTLNFDHVGSGLISKDGEPLKWFAVAGYDKKFVWADAKIDGDKVILWSEEVPHPAYVRYAWADNPAGVNFYNAEGLPASPFQAQVADVNKLWHGKKAAVVLTYDDALEVHLDNAIPLLDSLGFKGTFYISAAYPGVKNRIKDWKRAAANGHELGNHTLFHPCDAAKPGRSWVMPQNDLSKYTTAQIVQEIEMTNTFLKSLDGKDERTFAYTCGDTETGEGSFVAAIQDMFVAMRGVESRLNKIENLNLNNLNCYVVTEQNADQMIEWAEKAKAENALLVILFHGVGGEHPINVDLKKHNDFLKYLKNHEEDYWVTTLLEASRHSIEQLKK